MKGTNYIYKKNIDEFKQTDPVFFDQIHKDLTTHPVFKWFTPLDLLNNLYMQLEIIELNIDDPINLTNHLFELQLQENKILNTHLLLAFLEYLFYIVFVKKSFLFNKNYNDEPLPIFYFYFKEFLDEKIEKLHPQTQSVKPNPNKILYKFNTIKKELEYFNNNIEKLLYLHEAKTNFLLKYPDIKDNFPNPIMDIDFDKKCDLEIKKLHEFIKLEKMQPLDQVQQVEYENADFKNIKNNFDNVSIERVYNHFKNELVEKNYLSEEALIDYIKLAFEKMESPKEKFHFSHTPKKQSITKVFYLYYKDIAGRPHRKQKEYAKLLGDYFEGYNVKNVSANFSKF